MLDNMLEDRVSLVKSDGTFIKDNVPALVMKGKIQIHDYTLPIEVGDHLLRKLPNTLVEDYIVNDPVLNVGLGKKFYTVHVHRSGVAAGQQSSVIHHIVNNFNGPNSRVNINSSDNSTNIIGSVDIERLVKFLDQVKPAISGLPDAQRKAISVPLALLDDEIRAGSPSSSKVDSALHSIKTIAEGATGNLIATGIIGLIAAITGTPVAF